MNKIQTLDSIIKIKNYHEQQMLTVEAVLSKEKTPDFTEKIKNRCEFTQWLEDDKVQIKKLAGLQFYEEMQKLHTRWHIQFHKIQTALQPEKKTFFQKVLQKDGPSQMQLDKAKLYYSDLKEISTQLVSVVNSSYKRVSALSESKFID